jgi:hypothetical protein
LGRYAKIRALTDLGKNARSDYDDIYRELAISLPPMQRTINSARGAIQGHERPIADKKGGKAKKGGAVTKTQDGATAVKAA